MTKRLSDAGMQMYRARQAAEAPRAAFADLMADTERGDAMACRAVVQGVPVEEAIRCLSTSETIAVALAFSRVDLLPSEHQDIRDAWCRLDRRQRRLFETMAWADRRY